MRLDCKYYFNGFLCYSLSYSHLVNIMQMYQNIIHYLILYETL